jgi:hypothetical protein
MSQEMFSNSAAPQASSEAADVHASSSSMIEGSGDSNEADEALLDAASKPKDDKKVEEIRKKLKKVSIKYNGKEMEEDLPFEIDDDPKAIEYMQKVLQMSKLGSSKAQDYAALEREVMEFVDQLRNDPKAVLRNPKVGIDIKKLAAEILRDEMENEAKSPEQREREALEAKIKELEDKQKQRLDEEEQREVELLEEKEFQKLNSVLEKTFSEHSLPKNPYYVKKVATLIRALVMDGQEPSSEVIANHIKNEGLNDLKQILGSTSEEMIEELFGDTYERVRKLKLSKARKNQPVAQPVPNKKVEDVGSVKAPKAKTEEKPMTYKEFFNNL